MLVIFESEMASGIDIPIICSRNRVDSLCVEGQQDQSIDTPNLFMSLHFRESLNRNDTKAK